MWSKKNLLYFDTGFPSFPLLVSLVLRKFNILFYVIPMTRQTPMLRGAPIWP